MTSSFNIFHSSFKDPSPVAWFCLSAVVCIALFIIALSIGPTRQDSLQTEVNVYCASAAVEPFSKIVDQFNSSDLARSERVVAKITRVGGSGVLAGQLNAEALMGIHEMADVFVSADSNRMSKLVDKKAIVETFPIATQFPVIAICSPTNTDLLHANDLSSLLNLEIKLGIGSVTSAIGSETRRIAQSNQCLDLLQARKTVDFENVMSLAQALSIGSIDAAIVWDSTVHQFNQTNKTGPTLLGSKPNRPAIKILAYLQPSPEESILNPPNPKATSTSSKQKLSPIQRFGKFSPDKADNSTRPGCFIEVGRSTSDSQQADLFFSFLKTNRDNVLSEFVDAGFSNLDTESSLDNGRESKHR
ncbi:substrate-binding domain-containing protein [Mariniblastus sp.]|nr:substrate-binding domain-containing protein [Mariniblastus sp.]